jgi:hypothetical protein
MMTSFLSSFAFDMKASLVTGNLSFHKYLKYSKIEELIYPGQQNYFEFLRHEDSLFLYSVSDVHMPHLLHIFYQL